MFKKRKEAIRKRIEERMEQRKTVVHFGAGALGKGLVIPVLRDSGYKVAVVDANPEVVAYLKEKKKYRMKIASEVSRSERDIDVEDAMLIGGEDARIVACVRKADTVTTSVRRENLGGVAALIRRAWADGSDGDRRVLCCENIENVSRFFSGLLRENGGAPERIKIPDTVVDRGCASDPSDRMSVITEPFFEIGVDAKVLPDTRIRLIPSVENLEKDFMRKRFLMNTFADVVAYFGLMENLAGFGAAVRDAALQARLAPYFNLIRLALQTAYGMSDEEYARWRSFYMERMGGADNGSRPMESIARGIWDKLDYKERIVYPVVLAGRNAYDIGAGTDVVAAIVANEIGRGRMSAPDAKTRCETMWCVDEIGKRIFARVWEKVESCG
ncbi:MAG: hypothetical protein LBO81_02110 [Clostridiales Family XIII bacterium]|jgi:mannitol-1-phosphate 5-dehydrogenase|nr:hypothetical protein [Clostridiales Family XIII bacterium]